MKKFLGLLVFFIYGCSDPSPVKIEIEESLFSLIFDNNYSVIIESKSKTPLLLYKIIVNDGQCRDIVKAQAKGFGTTANVKDKNNNRFSNTERLIYPGGKAGYNISKCAIKKVTAVTDQGNFSKNY